MVNLHSDPVAKSNGPFVGDVVSNGLTSVCWDRSEDVKVMENKYFVSILGIRAECNDGNSWNIVS